MEPRWRKQPCNTVIDCEFKPCYNVTPASCIQHLPFTDKYCTEQQQWYNSYCRPKLKPSCCRRIDRNKATCERLGHHPTWSCLRDQIQQQNNKTMAALTSCKYNKACTNWKYGNPYYTLGGPIYHPPGMQCTDYSLYIPTDRLKEYCNRHLARFRMHRRKRRNILESETLKTHPLDTEDRDSLLDSFEEYSEESSENNPERKISDPTETLQNFKPNFNGKSQAVDANLSLQNLLENHPNSKFNQSGGDGGGDEGENKAGQIDDEEKCPKCNDIGEAECRKKVNNGNHFDNCTCRLCVKKKGITLAKKITDNKAEVCRKLWLKSYEDPCSKRGPACVDGPQQEVNPETGDVICTKCANCPCPVCCKQRAYARIKPHHYHANGLSHPDLKYKKMTFLDGHNNNIPDSEEQSELRLTKLKNKKGKENLGGGSVDSECSGDSFDMNNNCGSKGYRKRQTNNQQPDLDPDKFRYNDEGIENAEYYTGDCVKENPTRKSFGLDVTYRQCCCEEEEDPATCKKRPSFLHAKTQYCNFPHPLDVEKTRIPVKRKPKRMILKKKVAGTDPLEPAEDTGPQECMYDIRLPTPTDYNTTTYRQSYTMPMPSCKCNPGRYGSQYHPNRLTVMRDWEVYPMEFCGQGDDDNDEQYHLNEKNTKSGKSNNGRKGGVGVATHNTGTFRNKIRARREDETKSNSEMFNRYLRTL